MSAPTENLRTFYCKSCHLLFTSFDALRKHKASMREKGKTHFHCPYCDMDFKTEYAEIKHIKQDHAQQQDLTCPGCGQGPFSRVGGLMQHIESECIRINVNTIEEMREKKTSFSQALVTLTKEPLKADYSQYMPSSSNASIPNDHPVVSQPEPPKLTGHDFPGLPPKPMDLTDQALPRGGAALWPIPKQPENQSPGKWGTKTAKDLFPNAPAVQRPTQEQLAVARAPNAKAEYLSLDPDDPDNPGFNVGRYYDRFSDKFQCPKLSCNKSFKKGGGLIGHLRSDAHNKKYECPYCHKRFPSLKAIVQHAESQGNFCHMRDSANHGAFMHQLTGGLIDVHADRFEDGTVRYVTSETAREEFRGPVKEDKGKGRAIDEPNGGPVGGSSTTSQAGTVNDQDDWENGWQTEPLTW